MTKLNLVESFEEAEQFMRWLGERRDVLAVDTETGGLEWWHQPLRLVQFGDAETGWAIPWDDWAGVVREAFRRYDGQLVMHNAKFDVHFLERFGIDVRRDLLDDSMLMAHVVDPTRSVALKALASEMIHPDAAKGEKELKQAMRSSGWTWGTIPVTFEPYWQYAALDVILTARIHRILKPVIDAEFTDIYDLEMACLDVLLRMESKGARIDLDYVHAKRDEMLAYVTETRRWVYEQFGVENATSNAQVIKRLQADGVPFTKRTAKGAPSLDEEVLSALQEIHPLADAVLKIRKTEKLLKSYFTNFLEMETDEILHPSIRQVGARTGRMSITQPALQTLPRGPVVRDAFVPRDGNKLVLADFDQVEMRVFAHFANEEGMIDAIHNGVDLHNYVCRELYHIPPSVPESEVKKDPRRQVTKNANFAKVYVAGVKTFAKTAGITEDEAYEFFTMYDERFPGAKRFHETVDKAAYDRYIGEGVAYVNTPYGRRHPGESDKLYKLVNYLIQGTCADLLKEKLVHLDAAGLGDYMILPVHDEVVFDVPENEVEEVGATVKDVMEEHEKFRVPLSVGVDVVQRWGDKYR